MRAWHFLILIFIFSSVPQIHAYTSCNGIEDGDVVLISYAGEFTNGSVFDTQDKARFVITRDKLIDGFYYNIVGMKEKEWKTFLVLPEEGYLNPEDLLFGTTLIFEVFIENSISDIVLCSSEEKEGLSDFQILINALMIMLGISLLLIFIRSRLKKSKSKLCVHCFRTGIKIPASGLCAKCGNPHCTSSFRKGCTECGANTFSRFT